MCLEICQSRSKRLVTVGDQCVRLVRDARGFFAQQLGSFVQLACVSPQSLRLGTQPRLLSFIHASRIPPPRGVVPSCPLLQAASEAVDDHGMGADSPPERPRKENPEQERIVAEDARERAEEHRDAAEKRRDDAEWARRVAERGRDTAEQARAVAEEARTAAQEARKEAKELRERLEEQMMIVREMQDTLRQMENARLRGSKKDD